MWPPDGATCIGSKVGYQVASLAMSHCLIASEYPIGIVCSCKGGCYDGAGEGEGSLLINHSGSLNLINQYGVNA